MTAPKQYPSDLPPIVLLGDPELAQISEPVPPEDIGTETFQSQLDVLRRSMEAIGANGIAAPQIGIGQRFFMMNAVHRDDPNPGPQEFFCFINPEIVEASNEMGWAWEGCLSVPGYRGWLRRPMVIAVRGFNERGEGIARELTGWTARAFQHEYDHLDGMIFPYRLADPHFMVSGKSFESRADWTEGWPAPNARAAKLGEIVPD